MHGTDRLHSLDAVRAFALLAGIVLHATMSFLPGMFPGIWAYVDTAPSTTLSVTMFTIHMFRMSLFFLLAGFFAHMSFQRKGMRDFLADRGKRILLPLCLGWILLFPLISMVWNWGLTRLLGSVPQIPKGFLPADYFPLFHLWFLYVLILLYAGALALHVLFDKVIDRKGHLRRGIDALVRIAVPYLWGPAILAVPVALGLYYQNPWIGWFGVPTPDSSYIPSLAAMVSFGMAFGLGWLLHRQAHLMQSWTKTWPFYLALAVACTAYCLYQLGLKPAFVPTGTTGSKALYAATYAFGCWNWIFALIGLGMRFLTNENRAIRYLADSSYWLYLVHLPLVAGLAVVVGPLQIHWALKFGFILGVSIPLMLLSYEYLVRYTVIGRTLNGPRKRPLRGAMRPVLSLS